MLLYPPRFWECVLLRKKSLVVPTLIGCFRHREYIFFLEIYQLIFPVHSCDGSDEHSLSLPHGSAVLSSSRERLQPIVCLIGLWTPRPLIELLLTDDAFSYYRHLPLLPHARKRFENQSPLSGISYRLPVGTLYAFTLHTVARTY